MGEINQFRFSPHNTIQINSTCIRAKCKEKQNPKQNTIKIRRYLFLTIRWESLFKPKVNFKNHKIKYNSMILKSSNNNYKTNKVIKISSTNMNFFLNV